ncbi:MAG: hypothetical protein ACU0B9_07340 [Limimaricola soesokkakensis]|uniref:hypothetical protein n=1 Tax=Limimaricola soesokkakensis TaxID=1343159 RepID=UPI004059BA4E
MFDFAWVLPSETAFDPAVHDHEDEDVFAFQIDHAEGDFPMLSIEIRNPRRQLLAGEAIWAWLSRDGVPLFFGRLVAIPEEMEAEIVRLSFIARPAGYPDIKRALAQTLRVAPYWDPVWITPERVDDPDTVLEARTQIWHIDRVSHAVTVSDIISGEDGTIALGEADYAYDSLDVQFGSPPVRRVRVDAEISWDQIGRGSIDVTRDIRSAFGGSVASYTGQGLEADWPGPGVNLRGGWTVERSELRRVDGVSRPVVYRDVAVSSIKPRSEDEGAKAEAFRSMPYRARFYRWEFIPRMALAYDVSRARTEQLRFTLAGDVQRVFSEPGDEEEIILSLASQRVAESIDPGGAIPLRATWAPAYTRTDRGMDSLRYLVSLARAKLLARARAVEVRVAVPLDTALGFSCRQNVTITDPRLPAGSATGKISSYRIVVSGDGAQYGEVTISCTIGTGDAVTAVPGVPTWSEEDYASGYQVRDGETVDVVPGQVTVESTGGAGLQDDGIDFSDMSAATNIRRLDVENGPDAQEAVLDTRFPDVPAAVEELNRNHTRVWMDLRPLTGGPFLSDYSVRVSQLAVPMTMEL